ncbi:MAG: hypothetical protein WA921_05835 [Ahrensia sp.]
MNKPNDIVDVEFEIVGDADAARAQAPQTERADAGAQANSKLSQDADRVQLGAFGNAAQPQKAERMSLAMFTLVAVLASFAAFSVGAAYAYFAQPTGPILPQASQPVDNVAANQDVMGGLLLHDLSFETGVSNGREFMAVEGVVVNQGAEAMIIPPLRLLFGPDGQTKARYRIERGETLQPGEQLVFTNRIPLRDTEPVGASLEFIR